MADPTDDTPDEGWTSFLSEMRSSAIDLRREVVVDQRTGVPRQAGSDTPEGIFIRRAREAAERDLYIFSKGILGRDFLSPVLHRDVCAFLQHIPPYRKLLLLPRLHAKTAIVSCCLPIHMHIQSAATNPYFPGMDGSECRILLCGETEGNATKNLRVIKSEYERNPVLRSLWPHRCWLDPRREARKWSDSEIILPRTTEYPDPSIRAVGVGGAITGARPNCLLKDDLISIEAANSSVVMQTAIDWHIASRALLDVYDKETGLQSIEVLIGTHWATHDLYSYITENDPTVEVVRRSIFESRDDGTPHIIWPERFTWEKIDELKREFGSLFWLLYMNQPHNAELVDFDLAALRTAVLSGDSIEYEEDTRDERLIRKYGDPPEDVVVPSGIPLTSDTHDTLFPKGHHWRFRS